MKHRHSIPLTPLASCLALLLSSTAFAQEPAATKAKAKPQAAEQPVALEKVTVVGNAANPPNEKPQLDIPSVTGSRLGLTPRETPASITIIDRATIEQRGAQTTQEALERAPGIIVAPQPGSAGSVSMRGFTGAQITQLFNGITVQYDVIAARPIDSWLTEKVEVLGGPSTFLYGQGAVGGSINYVSKVAERGRQGHQALFELGEYLNRRASYDYSTGLGNGHWFRAVLSYLGSEGYVERTPFNSGVMSFSLLSDLTDNLSNTVAVEYQMEDRQAYWGTPLLNPTTAGRFDPATRFKNYNSLNPVFDQQVLWVRNITDYQMSEKTQFKNTIY